jgi:hypothetical protein
MSYDKLPAFGRELTDITWVEVKPVRLDHSTMPGFMPTMFEMMHNAAHNPEQAAGLGIGWVTGFNRQFNQEFALGGTARPLNSQIPVSPDNTPSTNSNTAGNAPEVQTAPSLTPPAAITEEVDEPTTGTPETPTPQPRNFGMGFLNGLFARADEQLDKTGAKKAASEAHGFFRGMIDRLTKRDPRQVNASLGMAAETIAASIAPTGELSGIGSKITDELNKQGKANKKPSSPDEEQENETDAHAGSKSLRKSAILTKSIGKVTGNVIGLTTGNDANAAKRIETVNKLTGAAADGLELAANIGDLGRSLNSIGGIVKKAGKGGDQATQTATQLVGNGLEIGGEAASAAISSADIIHGGTAAAREVAIRSGVDRDVAGLGEGALNIAEDTATLRVDNLAKDVVKAGKSAVKVSEKLPVIGGIIKSVDNAVGFVKKLDSIATFMQDPVGNTAKAITSTVKGIQDTAKGVKDSISGLANFITRPFRRNKKDEGGDDKTEDKPTTKPEDTLEKHQRLQTDNPELSPELNQEQEKIRRRAAITGHNNALAKGDAQEDSLEQTMKSMGLTNITTFGDITQIGQQQDPVEQGQKAFKAAGLFEEASLDGLSAASVPVAEGQNTIKNQRFAASQQELMQKRMMAATGGDGKPG